MCPETHQDGRSAVTGVDVASAPTVDAAAVLSRETLARRVALLEGLLREVEWGGIQIDRALDDDRLLLERACPSCGHSKSHRPACRLAAALADGGREDCR